eukprot:gene15236-biopygen12229
MRAQRRQARARGRWRRDGAGVTESNGRRSAEPNGTGRSSTELDRTARAVLDCLDRLGQLSDAAPSSCTEPAELSWERAPGLRGAALRRGGPNGAARSDGAAPRAADARARAPGRRRRLPAGIAEDGWKMAGKWLEMAEDC